MAGTLLNIPLAKKGDSMNQRIEMSMLKGRVWLREVNL